MNDTQTSKKFVATLAGVTALLLTAAVIIFSYTATNGAQLADYALFGGNVAGTLFLIAAGWGAYLTQYSIRNKTALTETISAMS